jgi:phosphatidylinositol-3-phosphatase
VTRMDSRRSGLLGGLLLLAVVLVALAAIVLLVARGGPFARSTPSIGSTASAGGSSAGIGPKRVWLIVMENRSYDQVMGNNAAPFINDLAARYGQATDYHGVARPSQPNYLALVSGSTQGISDDRVHDVDAPTLFDQLEAAGHSWRVFAENVPSGCFRGDSARNGADGPGTYARKHEPAISFTSISGTPGRCARIGNLSSFDPAAADFNLIVPNLCHDMHDCSTRTGDSWLAQFVPRITGSDAFRQGGLLVITFDEASDKDDSQHTILVFAGNGVRAGMQATEHTDHYALLRTIQTLFGLGCLGQSCQAAPIPELLAGS